MRLLTKEELARATVFLSLDLPTAYLELTQTGLDKSIMDATESVRRFLADAALHDYRAQLQGTDAKVTLEARFIRSSGEIVSAQVSLYRPVTKNGDPRIWIYGLKAQASAGDVIILTVIAGELWVSNLTKTAIDLIAIAPNELSDALAPAFASKTLVVDDLTQRLLEICAGGFIPAPGAGDTMVGRVLETALGIDANSSKAPDFYGIELKAYRLKPNSSSHAMKRRNLFAKTPDWGLSTLKSSRQILDNFGYESKGILRLYCELRASKFNTQGLGLQVDQAADVLNEVSNRADLPHVATWPLGQLQQSLSDKHAETFWVGAQAKKLGGLEYFRYVVVEHTQQPLVEQFGPLVTAGAISLDHLIKAKGTSASEKGPLFKIDNASADMLFPSPKVFALDGTGQDGG